jgi:hypothetical protein
MASSILPLIMTYAFLSAQIPIDETKGQSTITVKKKKKKKEEDTAAETPKANVAPPPPRAPRAVERRMEPPVQPPVARPEPPPPQPPPPPQRLTAPPPAAAPSAAGNAQLIQTERPRPVRILPWVTLAGSVVATGIGVFFAVQTTKALAAQNELEFEINTSKSKVNIPEEFTDNQRSIFINGITSTVLISAGISGAIASTVALTID